MKILVVSDIHANLDAIEAVLDRGAPSCEGFVCLGDITGYGPDPEECVRLVRSLESSFDPCRIIAGNHDAALSGKIPAEWFNKGAQFTLKYSKKALSSPSLEWLSRLSPSMDFSPSVHLSHGSPVEPLTGYLWGGLETVIALSWIADREQSLCFCGHTHEASIFSAREGESLADHIRYPEPGTLVSVASGPVIVNPGSTGFPRSFNGGRTPDMEGSSEPITEACFPAYYAVWDTEGNTVEFRDVRYDRRPVEDRIDRMN